MHLHNTEEAALNKIVEENTIPMSIIDVNTGKPITNFIYQQK